jgi:ribosomal protein S16
MAKLTGKPAKRPEDSIKVKRRQAPGRTIESRENQVIRLAYDLVEKRIKNGTATSQEVTHFLKTGSVVAQLEKAKLEKENELLKAKTEALQSQKRVEELYANSD